MGLRAVRALLAAAFLFAGAIAAAHPPYGLVADARGNIYFSDLETVWKLEPGGRLSVFRPRVEGRHVHELALAPDGAIEGDQNSYDPATERFTSGLWRRAPGGEEREVVAMTDSPPRGTGVWQDQAGDRYTSQWVSNDDRRLVLLRRRRDGRVDVLFEDPGAAAALRQPAVGSVGGMAFGADGSVAFADGRVIRRWRPDERVERLFEGPEGASLRGLASAADGRLLAADMGRRLVLAIDSGGEAETLYRAPPEWLPTAAAEIGGRLLVLEANADPYERSNRVRLVEAHGSDARLLAAPGDPAAVPTAPAVPAAPEAERFGRGALAAAAVAALALSSLILRRVFAKRGGRGRA